MLNSATGSGNSQLQHNRGSPYAQQSGVGSPKATNSQSICYHKFIHLLKAEMTKTQTVTVACKLKVDREVAKEIDDTLLTFSSACDWVNQNTPQVLGEDVANFRNGCQARRNASRSGSTIILVGCWLIMLRPII